MNPASLRSQTLGRLSLYDMHWTRGAVRKRCRHWDLFVSRLFSEDRPRKFLSDAREGQQMHG